MKNNRDHIGNKIKITHYLYNAFIIQAGDKKIAIDPGGLMFYFFRFTTLIPKSEWNTITHIFVTHGDPDHYWHADRLAEAAGAPIICNKTMIKNVDGKNLILGPRDKGLAFTTAIKKIHTLSVDETIEVDGMTITGIKTTHGSLTIPFGPISKTLTPGPDERMGWGSIGFQIQFDGKTIVNLGDTLLHADEWKSIMSPDILMIPIGGKAVHNTMDEKEALQAVQIMKPKLVIPCHYNCPAFFSKKYNPANELEFKREVEKLDIKCTILHKGDSINY
jgi:L-ascorbate metabolism protein UlaG (beta-lactamase superfamily)